MLKKPKYPSHLPNSTNFSPNSQSLADASYKHFKETSTAKLVAPTTSSKFFSPNSEALADASYENSKITNKFELVPSTATKFFSPKTDHLEFKQASSFLNVTDDLRPATPALFANTTQFSLSSSDPSTAYDSAAILESQFPHVTRDPKPATSALFANTTQFSLSSSGPSTAYDSAAIRESQFPLQSQGKKSDFIEELMSLENMNAFKAMAEQSLKRSKRASQVSTKIAEAATAVTEFGLNTNNRTEDALIRQRQELEATTCSAVGAGAEMLAASAGEGLVMTTGGGLGLFVAKANPVLGSIVGGVILYSGFRAVNQVSPVVGDIIQRGCHSIFDATRNSQQPPATPSPQPDAAIMPALKFTPGR